ncbi:VOC family protein [Belliella pelovolcani]|uniref:Lactoylglutathione lyase n=1 Tax=Belliella pelovolcani TaxID=529505 RepID=A0A1N7PNG9_9BACT|nr:VOC family protein [Belliella pelovolcani]SIT12128.1 lactoylglutathione lyase [Belliella pelovolcani]
MKIEHIALWVSNLEKVKDFYVKYFDMSCSQRYHNPKKQFTSYFLSFSDGGVRIELMHKPDILEIEAKKKFTQGFAHFAISVGSKEKVNELTERFRNENIPIVGEPRTTGDGYYESIILDIEGNLIEITI